MEIVIGISWTIGLFLLLYWSGQHSTSIISPSWYAPHVSHFCLHGYISIPMWILSAMIFKKDNEFSGGAIFCFLFGLWHMYKAIRLFAGYINKKEVSFRD